MKSFTVFILITLCSLTHSLAQEATKDNTEYLRPQNKHRVKFILFSLLGANEQHSHNLGDVKTNMVYLHQDGQLEMVVDAEGKPVEDCANRASYNYYHVRKQPLKHFYFDTLPWLELGNCKDDPTSKAERLEAYIKDFTDSVNILVANYSKVQTIDPNVFKSEDQIKTLNLFLRALNQENMKSYKFDGTDSWMNDKDLYDQFLKELQTNIKSILSSKIGS